MQSTKEIADFLGCTVQSVNRAIKKACEVYQINPSEFGSPDLRDKRVRRFSEPEIQMILEFAPQSKPAALPRETASLLPVDQYSGLTIHLDSSLSFPVEIEGTVSGNDTAYLLQMQQRLQQFETQHEQVLSQMRVRFERAQQLNAQYQQAMSLSDQLLLQEYQLKGMQLGYSALEVKQQAFKATVQAVESGNLPLPGKPISQEPLAG